MKIDERIKKAMYDWWKTFGVYESILKSKVRYLIVGSETLKDIRANIGKDKYEINKTGEYCYGLMIVHPSTGFSAEKNKNLLEVR